MADDHDDVQKHPSQVTVSFSRTTGPSRYLFGSPVPTNGTTIRMRVHRAELYHNLGEDWIHQRNCIAEVEFSPAQFAELFTTMNAGNGVPGTLLYFNGEQVERPVTGKTRSDRVRDKFQKDVKHLVDQADRMVKMIAEVTEKKTALTKDEKARLSGAATELRQHIASNIPFLVESFEEATDKVVTHAKAEIDSFVTHNIFRRGLKALFGDHASEGLPPLLEEEGNKPAGMLGSGGGGDNGGSNEG